MQIERVTYGEGGFDPSKPDGNVVEREWIDEPDDEPTSPAIDTKVVGQVRADMAKANTVKAMKDALGPLLDALS